MPLVKEPAVLGSIGLLTEPPAEAPSPALSETFGAAFRLENSISSFLNREQGTRSPGIEDPGDIPFDPFESIEGYEDYAQSFVFAENADDVAAVKRQIDRELIDQEILAASGATGMAAAIAAGLLDPTVLLPVGGAATKGFTLGRSILQGGLRTARAGAIGATAAEALLHASQETRTLGESAFNVAGATLLSGILGGSLAALRPIYSRFRISPVTRQTQDSQATAGYATDPRLNLQGETWRREVQARPFDDGRDGEMTFGREAARAMFPDSQVDAVRVVWQHAGNSGAGPQVLRQADLLRFAEIPVRFDPVPQTGSRRQNSWSRTYRVVEDGRRLEYNMTEATPTQGAERQLSVFVRPVTDAAAELSQPRAPGAPPDPNSDISVTRTPRAAPRPSEAAERLYAENTAELAERLERELTPDPEAPDIQEPGSFTISAEDAVRDATGPVRPPVRPSPGAAQGELPLEPPRGLPEADMELRAQERADPGSHDAEGRPLAVDGRSVGAASAAPTRAEDTLKSALGLERAGAFMDPLLRSLTSPLMATRRIAQELARSPFSYEKNTLGVPSPVSVEVRRDAWDWNLAEAMESADRLFVRYRTGKAGGGRFRALALQARDAGGRVLGRPAADGKLSRREFNEEIGRAMRLNDRHEIPEVAEAAQAYRRTLFDPLKDRAIETGQLPEDVAVDTADSYLQRVYNSEKIAAQRPDFVRVVTDWLKDRQSRRQALRDELQALLDNDEALGRLMRQTEGRAEGQEAIVQRSDVQLAEIRRLLERDIGRMMELRARGEATPEGRQFHRGGQRTDAQRAELSTSITRLRNRLNTLSDRRSGAAAQGDTLRAYLDDLQARYDVNRTDIDELLEAWPGPGRQTPEAKQVLKARLGLDENELADIAQQITDRILGTPDGRLPYDVKADVSPRSGPMRGAVERGPLRRRAFDIPDALIEPWLESDIELIARIYTRTMAADTEIAGRFGSVDMIEQIDDIRRESAARSNRARSDAERKRINKRKDDDIRDIAAMRDRLRGTYGQPANPHGFGARAERALGQINLLSKLGGVTVSSIPDIARPVMVEGLSRVLRHGLAPLVRNGKAAKLARQEAQFLAAVTERTLDTRMHAIADIGDSFGRHSRLERGLQGLADSFGAVSFIAPWNQFFKEFTGAVTMSRILTASRAWAAGTIGKADMERLAASGIGRDMARRIAREFKAHGIDDRGVLIAGHAEWTDREAANILRAAMIREIDNTIITPGVGQRPLWMTRPGWRLIGQFKSFSFASHQSVFLSGLQRRDAATFNGLALSVMMGMMVYALKSWQYGKAPSDDARVWLAEGVDRAGVTGYFFEVNNIAEKVTRGTIGVNALTGGPTMSRYASRNVVGAVLGPSYGTAQDIIQIIGNSFAGEFNQADTRRIRRLLPYQNLFYLRGLLDKAEAGINDSLGVEP